MILARGVLQASSGRPGSPSQTGRRTNDKRREHPRREHSLVQFAHASNRAHCLCGLRHRCPVPPFPEAATARPTLTPGHLRNASAVRERPPAARPVRKWILPPWEVQRQIPDESTSASWHALSHASISGRYSHSLRPGGCSVGAPRLGYRPLRNESRHNRVSNAFPDHRGRHERDLTARARQPRAGAHTRAT